MGSAGVQVRHGAVKTACNGTSSSPRIRDPGLFHCRLHLELRKSGTSNISAAGEGNTGKSDGKDRDDGDNRADGTLSPKP